MTSPPALPYGVRLAWQDLPRSVLGWVEAALGAPVVRADSQPGGFSPGVAARVVTADGARGFVKAVSTAQNPDTPDLLRREIRVLRSMPASAGVPLLLEAHDDGEWVGLLIEDVEGRHPTTPWVHAEIRATFEALRGLASQTAPEEWPALEDELRGDFAAWSRIAATPPRDLDPWLAGRLELLDGLSGEVLPRLAGRSITHTDTRADNLLLTPGGEVRVVDWPWAAQGAGWVDAAALLVNLELYGAVDPLDYLPLVRAQGATDRDVVGLVAGMGGLFTETSARPPAPGLPTVRAFQVAQGRACTRLLRRFGGL
ncbi:phosphotransferase [Ornithinimicrobium sediminis]|uniref:phosphotransferase n=1 Tax=Ornithinimicrobium sediminis TaxID=2904603 RepID=UPI001E50953F|nr:phosphotransferase [Ornithinimicrobium sediminis]MCE0488236.1 phosphotransferase [Ornithinimicrobium sediminis]